MNYRASSKKCPRIWHLRRGTKNNVSIFIEQHVIEKQRTKNITAHCDIYFDRKQNTVAHQNRGQLSICRLCYSHFVVIQIVYELKPNTRAPFSVQREINNEYWPIYSKASGVCRRVGAGGQISGEISTYEPNYTVCTMYDVRTANPPSLEKILVLRCCLLSVCCVLCGTVVGCHFG